MVGLLDGILIRIPQHPRRIDAERLDDALLYEADDEPCAVHGAHPARYTKTGECAECQSAQALRCG